MSGRVQLRADHLEVNRKWRLVLQLGEKPESNVSQHSLLPLGEREHFTQVLKLAKKRVRGLNQVLLKRRSGSSFGKSIVP